MRMIPKVLAALFLASAWLAAACAEESVRVAERPDGSSITDDGGVPTVLTCGVLVPTVYTSANFQPNAQEELDLRQRLLGIDAQMGAAEGNGTSIVTSATLKTIYELGTPNLRSISTSSATSLSDTYFAAFGDAQAQPWSPDLPESDAGSPKGGKYQGEYMSSLGLAIHPASVKTLLGGALYNHVLVVASGPITEATVDRFVASFGSTPALLGRTGADAGGDADLFLAAYATQRDDPSQPTGPYRRMRGALLAAKAAAAAGSVCQADLTAAISVFLASWERVTYASAIFALNDAAAKALAGPQQSRAALHSYAEALGLIQSFRGIAADRRTITDAQIDDLVSRMNAALPYALVTHAGDAVPKLVETIQTIAGIYAFSPADVQRFEKQF